MRQIFQEKVLTLNRINIIINLSKIKMENCVRIMAEIIEKDYKIDSFSFEERNAKIVYPNVGNNGKLLIKTEYYNAFPELEIELLNRGYTLCWVDHFTRWATKEEIDVVAKFVVAVCEKLGFEKKCIPIGMSCGGLTGAMLAARYPKLVSLLYLDAPVLNILSIAGYGDGEFRPGFWQELVSAYGFSRSTIINFRESPIDYLNVLIENDIPVVLVYGDADTTVIYTENGKVLEDYYKKNNGKIKVIQKSQNAHHPHGPTSEATMLSVIEFIERNS
ncbi:MAG: alpha/beta fold hydrolase [Clostridia bacterium]|nr:alpha/beta fold hydrolase [Clostridia bacterium]